MPTELSEVKKDGKREVSFNPLFPVLLGEISLDLPIQHMSADVIKMAGKKTNWPGGWNSMVDRTSLEQVAGIRDAQEAMYGIAVAFAQELKFNIDPQKGGVNVSAAVMYGKGEAIPRTLSPQSTFSGMICIKEGTKPMSLVIHNPHLSSRMHEPMVKDPKDFNPYTAPAAMLPLEANKLYIWPSWLEYEVPAQKMTNGPALLMFQVDFMPLSFQGQ